MQQVDADKLKDIALPIVVQVIKINPVGAQFYILEISDGVRKHDGVYLAKDYFRKTGNTFEQKFRDFVFIRINKWNERFVIEDMNILLSPHKLIGKPKSLLESMPPPTSKPAPEPSPDIFSSKNSFYIFSIISYHKTNLLVFYTVQRQMTILAVAPITWVKNSKSLNRIVCTVVILFCNFQKHTATWVVMVMILYPTLNLNHRSTLVKCKIIEYIELFTM